MDCAEIKKTYSRLMKAYIKDISIYYLLRTIPIKCFETDPIPDAGEKYAFTDGKTVYLIADKHNTEQEVMFSLIHEILHILLGHKQRGVGKDHFKWNVAADIKINKGILSQDFYLKAEYARDTDINEIKENEVFERLIVVYEIDPVKDSTETIYDKIKEIRDPSNRKMLLYVDIIDYKEDGKGKQINAGLAEYVKQPEANAYKYLQSKVAGLTGGMLKEVVVNGRDEKKDYAMEIFKTIYHEAKKTRDTWRKYNRRISSMPGKEKYGKEIWALVDGSGSIPEATFNMFNRVVDKLLEKGINVNLVYWDTDVVIYREKTRITGKKKRVRRYGGTRLGVVFEKIKPYFKKGRDIIAVLTDGYIADYDEALKQYYSLRPRASILITTGKKIDFFDKTILIGETK